MRLRNLFFRAGSPAICALVFALGIALPALAASPVVRDGNTIQLGEITYRLDGVDAPELDQICIDNHADSWNCGAEARDQLTKLIGGRPVHCDDRGPDKNFRKRHLGVCTVAGETASLNQQLVRLGFALDLEPSAKSRFAKDQADARNERRGLWKGCFVSPQEFRRGKRDGTLLGGSCPADKDREIRGVLFPDDPAMPSHCSIKARFAVRAHVTGNIGIYHLQGCPSYPALTKPDRWFCSEDDARAAGFRRAFNCRARQ
ncbi:thermonuclease family protein [Bradyrhizobium sp. dw_78]|uniref:thermonuclease family protein n=1 Tax=Bradyrhizobium sp. dw_78 TaxID=2719793 RepID=UPI001BD38051|nr:thermonuclease family protein [Bradyrhizobium sp. dw_78]